ncbi:hypothetical protein CSUI_006460, partial [Cystoisospora suis]
LTHRNCLNVNFARSLLEGEARPSLGTLEPLKCQESAKGRVEQNTWVRTAAHAHRPFSTDMLCLTRASVPPKNVGEGKPSSDGLRTTPLHTLCLLFVVAY